MRGRRRARLNVEDPPQIALVDAGARGVCVTRRDTTPLSIALVQTTGDLREWMWSGSAACAVAFDLRLDVLGVRHDPLSAFFAFRQSLSGTVTSISFQM
jgi:hypothetical protein